MLPRELLLDDEPGKGDLIADTEAEENAAGIEACGAVRVQQDHERDALDEKVRARADPAIDAGDEEAGADEADDRGDGGKSEEKRGRRRAEQRRVAGGPLGEAADT